LRSEFMVGFEVSDEEVSDLVAFLEALTDDRFLFQPSYSNPWVK
jgi:cytochrome c peroxidase